MCYSWRDLQCVIINCGKDVKLSNIQYTNTTLNPTKDPSKLYARRVPILWISISGHCNQIELHCSAAGSPHEFLKIWKRRHCCMLAGQFSTARMTDSGIGRVYYNSGLTTQKTSFPCFSVAMFVSSNSSPIVAWCFIDVETCLECRCLAMHDIGNKRFPWLELCL
jgi:hypothetical protein